MKILGFVPAKSNSSRLKDKNMLPINGKPLFINAAENLAKVIPRENIYIDTNDDKYISLAQNSGFNFIKRSLDQTSNSFTGNDLLEWELSQVECDIAIQHLPTMPFLKKSTLQKGLDSVISRYDSVLCHYCDSFYTWTNETPNYNIKSLPNSFELLPTKIEGMGLYIVNSRSFNEHKTRVCGQIFNLELDHFERVDINYEQDYLFAKSISKSFIS
jgi:CMP-N-acetylneuraminic acid synthetase